MHPVSLPNVNYLKVDGFMDAVSLTTSNLVCIFFSVLFFLYGLGSLINKAFYKLFHKHTLQNAQCKPLTLHWEWIPFILLCLACTLVPLFIQNLCLRLLANQLPINPVERTLFVTFLGQMGLLGLLYQIFFRITHTFSGIGQAPSCFLQSFLRSFTYYCEVLPLLVPITIVWQVFLRWLMEHQYPVVLDTQPIVHLLSENALSPGYLILTGISVICLAPLCEEWLFRGIVYRFLNTRFNHVIALTVSSFLFAVLHLHFASFLPLFFLGCWLGYAYRSTGDIKVSIFLHALFNGTNYLLLVSLQGNGSVAG
ncbi:MAG: CPBP family intramembrane metalloprotease [Puniceicoccales bacterium]|jgi:membrane protease YdiL (CAAX protease family)|nr:CPBP family intramembrane metalloprotease [Puniceicoccales bacterium]